MLKGVSIQFATATGKAPLTLSAYWRPCIGLRTTFNQSWPWSIPYDLAEEVFHEFLQLVSKADQCCCNRSLQLEFVTIAVFKLDDSWFEKIKYVLLFQDLCISSIWCVQSFTFHKFCVVDHLINWERVEALDFILSYHFGLRSLVPFQNFDSERHFSISKEWN